jgi:A/G-specific adenine glycosylase
MSQQSTLVSAQPYWERWMTAFPTLGDLARAEQSQVLSLWAGLGYYSRARNVYQSARQLSLLKTWPQTWKEWAQLPGVGPYTAKAITASCFSEAVLPVDGNVVRWVSRYQGIPNALNSSSDRQKVEDFVSSLANQLPAQSHRTWVHIVMELGSQLCRSQNPKCADCALSTDCVSFAKWGGLPRWPQAKQRAPVQKVSSLQLVYWKNKSPVLRQRLSSSRLADQWELPTWDWATNDPRLNKILSKFNVLGRSTHAITKYRFDLIAVDAGKWRGALPNRHKRFADLSHRDVVTTATQKILSLLSF